MALSHSLAAIARQEAALVFDCFDAGIAWALGSVLRGWAGEADLPIAIEAGLFHHPLFFAAMCGATPDNTDWIRRKANVVRRYHRSSYAVGLEMAAKGATLESRYGLPVLDYAAHGGAFPIRVSGAVAGYVAVSGLPQRDDHRLVVKALCHLLGHDFAALDLSEG